jgi:deoxyribonuclease V
VDGHAGAHRRVTVAQRRSEGVHLPWLPVEFEAPTLPEAQALQRRLAAMVREEAIRGGVRLVAGADAAYESGGVTHAAVAIWDLRSGRVIETATASAETRFPYVPGFLAWRELPAVLAAFWKLTDQPDLVVVDGHGRAHPRRCGLACLVGLALDIPTAGCAKSILVGGFSGLATVRGARAPLVDRGEVIGVVLRTRSGVRPVYVSVGHRITLELACRQVLAASRFRIPEPLRAAHTAVTRLRGGGIHGA